MKWKEHRKFAKLIGISEREACNIDFLLDFLGSFKNPHKHVRKFTHDPFTAMIISSRYGVKGMVYALMHVVLDELAKYKVKSFL